MSKFLWIFLGMGAMVWSSPVLAQSSQGGPVDFATQIQPIFTKYCIGCHGGASPRQQMSLEEGKSYDAIVNVASHEAAGVMRVKPSDAENSYLYRKLEGEQTALGGSGGQMPFGRSPLSAEELALIEDWINQGALKELPPTPTAVEASAWGQVKHLVEGWVK